MLDIVLMTTGRRTGEPREARLYAYPDGERLIVIASGGGKEPEPRWAGNLRARPDAHVRRGRGKRAPHEPVHAREIPAGAERDRLWAIATATFPYYERYALKLGRPIAVFLLEPRDA